MKLPSLFFASLACAASVRAQYFSDGWQPGQAVTREAAPSLTPGVEPSPEYKPPEDGDSANSPFDISRILSSGPIASLFGKMGVNISERLSEARAKSELWDSRVPLITDDNYEDTIVNEPLTPEEEEKRVWFLVVSVSASQTSSLSKLVDEEFDSAFNSSLIEKDLPNVRWGRIDYFNVTYITTKWSIWQGPYLVLLKDRGQTLRFYKANQVRLSAEIMRNFLKEDGWQHTPSWNSAFAPGGKREFVLHYFAIALTKIYNILVVFPRWLLMIISGGLASVVMRILHRNSEASQPQREQKSKTESTTESAAIPAAAPSAPTSTASPGKPKAKARKGRK